MPIELVPLANATITLAPAFALPGTPSGTRMIAEVEDFVYEGERLRGRMKGRAAADWMTGDERYTWLNTIQAVGKGTLSEDARTLTYELR